MRYEFRMNAPQKPGWIARILLSLTTVALVVVGFFFFTIALIVGALIALIIGVRLWWMLRKLKRTRNATPENPASAEGALDGEFQVVERESSTERLPPAR